MKNDKIEILENLFNEDEINFFIDVTKNSECEYPIRTEDGYQNYYVRYFINGFSDYKIKLEKIVFDKFSKNYCLLNKAWINKVTNDTNTNDAYHYDTSDLTIITYLNDDFTGGNFEYIDSISKRIIKIKPKKGMSLIMDNNLLHRVSPVSFGERLSLVSFFELPKKENKSLI
jgi:oligoribonuclease NrnB/cAMP/cGMP phosphodiesterase (DHH superfamily)